MNNISILKKQTLFLLFFAMFFTCTFMSCEKEENNFLEQQQNIEAPVQTLIQAFENKKSSLSTTSFQDDCGGLSKISPYTINPDWTNVHLNLQESNEVERFYQIALLPDTFGLNTLARSTYLAMQINEVDGDVCAALVMKEWDIRLDTDYDLFSGGVCFIDEDGGVSDLSWYRDAVFEVLHPLDESLAHTCESIQTRDPKCPSFGQSWWSGIWGGIKKWFKDGIAGSSGSNSGSNTGSYGAGYNIQSNPFTGKTTNTGGGGSTGGNNTTGGNNDGILFSDAIIELEALAVQLSTCAPQPSVEELLIQVNNHFPSITVSSSTNGNVPAGFDPFVTHFMYNIGSSFDYATQEEVDDLLSFVASLGCDGSPEGEDAEPMDEELACIYAIREFEKKYDIKLTKPEILLMKEIDPCGSEGFDEDEAFHIINCVTKTNDYIKVMGETSSCANSEMTMNENCNKLANILDATIGPDGAMPLCGLLSSLGTAKHDIRYFWDCDNSFIKKRKDDSYPDAQTQPDWEDGQIDIFFGPEICEKSCVEILSHVIHESIHAKVFSLAFEKLPPELENKFPSTMAAFNVFNEIKDKEFDGINNLHQIMADYYVNEYATAMWEMSGQVGEPKDYLYWAYDGLGADPTFFLEDEEWQTIQSDWTDIEDQIDINCE